MQEGKYDQMDAKELEAVVKLLRERKEMMQFMRDQDALLPPVQLQRADRPGPAASRKGYGPTEPVPPKDPFKWG